MRETYPPLSTEDNCLLVSLADPVAPADATTRWLPKRLADVVGAARCHGVLPVMARKLRDMPAGSLPDDPASRAMLDALAERGTYAVGHSLMLRYHGKRVFDAFRAAGLKAAMLKGPVFADRLYATPTDRPFTDVDIILDEDDLRAANAMMTDLGFEYTPDGDADRFSALQEFKWLLVGNRAVMIELHGNLVHSPYLRRRLSFGLTDLLIAGESDAQGPAALVMVAVIHAAGGHKFSKLQLMVDIVQAVRALPPGGEETVLRVGKMLRAEFEVAVALRTAGDTLGDQRTLDLAAGLPASRAVIVSRRLVTPTVVLAAPTTRGLSSRLRRDAFRMIQRLAVRPGR